jgi:hypothetical protein
MWIDDFNAAFTQQNFAESTEIFILTVFEIWSGFRTFASFLILVFVFVFIFVLFLIVIVILFLKF